MGEKEKKPRRGYLLVASSVGIHLVVSTFAGLALGYWLDEKFHTAPWLLIIFTLIGTIAGFAELIRVAQKQESDEGEESDKDNGSDKENL